jgi:hypothetical protein
VFYVLYPFVTYLLTLPRNNITYIRRCSLAFGVTAVSDEPLKSDTVKYGTEICRSYTCRLKF